MAMTILPDGQAARLPCSHRLPPKPFALRNTLLRVHRGILGPSNPRGYHDHQEGFSPNGHGDWDSSSGLVKVRRTRDGRRGTLSLPLELADVATARAQRQ